MSNPQVGTIYQQIIADVIDSSRVDFEEGGVDDHVLEELKTVCRIRFFCFVIISLPPFGCYPSNNLSEDRLLHCEEGLLRTIVVEIRG